MIGSSLSARPFDTAAGALGRWDGRPVTAGPAARAEETAPMSDDTTRGPGQNGAEQPASGSVPPPPAPPAYDPSAHDASASSTDADAQRAYGEPPRRSRLRRALVRRRVRRSADGPLRRRLRHAAAGACRLRRADVVGPVLRPADRARIRSGRLRAAALRLPGRRALRCRAGLPRLLHALPDRAQDERARDHLADRLDRRIHLDHPVPRRARRRDHGHISLGQIKKNGEKGRGLALAGIIVGWVGVGLFVIGVIAFFALIAAGASSGSRYSA